MNFYSILEITPTASAEEIKKSFRRLAKIYHPDVNSDPDAESRFKLIYIAYDILSDSFKRQLYDELQAIRAADDHSQMRRWREHAHQRAQNYADMEYEEFEESLLSKIQFHSSQGIAFLFSFVLLCLGFIGIIAGSAFIFRGDFNGSITTGILLWLFGGAFAWTGGKAVLDVLETWK